MAIAPAFLDFLVHPVKKTPLFFDVVGQQLTDPTGNDRFIIKEGVPILLTSHLIQDLTITEQHKEAGTHFKYKEHYQNDAEAYDYTEESTSPVERIEIERLREHIVAQIPPSAEWILDIGCGGGWLSKAMVPKGKNVISTDISDINPIKAIKNLPSPNHFGLVADVFELPVKANSMDCIVASEIIEHVPDPKKFLAALYEVLKPGGRLIVTTPYNELIRTSLCIHCNRLTPHNAHLHSFTEKSMKKYLPQGASHVHMKVMNSKLLVKAHVQRALRALPLSVWSMLDDAALAVFGKKAYRLMVTIQK